MATQNLQSIKRRLDTVKSTLKITNAMKLVSSVKARKLQSFYDGRNYNYELTKKVFDQIIFLSKINPDATYQNELLSQNNESNKRLIIVVTSNVGLCASYNNNVIKEFKDLYKENDEVLLIGQKGLLELNNKDIPYKDHYLYLLNDLNHKEVLSLINDLKTYYLNKEYKEIYILYTHFINSIASKVQFKKFLPIDIKEDDKEGYSPLLMPDKEIIIDELINELLFSSLYYYLYDAKLAEETARRNAMDNATKNGEELIDKLHLEYNKARQASITQEITEVVAGSLKK